MVKDIYGSGLSDNPSLIHVGTNNLRSNQEPETIAINIVEVACNSKTDTNKVYYFQV